MTREGRTIKILEALKVRYPHAVCELDFESSFELLVAVILSAQCTDKRVNEVTKLLFGVVSTPENFAEMEQEKLEGYIRSCGFFRSKAKAIISASKDIVSKFDGKVPDNFEDITSLRGVGEKTAKVVLAEVYGQPYVAVDTHVFRVSRRLGLSSGATPEKVSLELEKIIPDWYKPLCHQLLIFHGRYCCKSQKPMCEECVVRDECEWLQKNQE